MFYCPQRLTALKGGPVSTSRSIAGTQQRDARNVIAALIYVDSELGESAETSKKLYKNQWEGVLDQSVPSKLGGRVPASLRDPSQIRVHSCFIAEISD